MKKRETSQVLAKVFGPLKREGETPLAVARAIHLPVDEVQRMIFGLVLTDVPADEAPVAPPPSAPKVAWKPRIVRSPGEFQNEIDPADGCDGGAVSGG